MAKQKEVNVKEEALSVFKTVAALERNYAADYLCRLLLGEDQFGLKDPDHSELETFGNLKGWYTERVHNLIRYLIQEAYLQVKNAQYGNLMLCKKGLDFILDPDDMFLPERRLKSNEWDRLIALELRHIRRELSEKAEIMPYEVFSNYALQCMVEQRPQSFSDLKGIPGLGDYRIDRFGPAILQAVKRALDKRVELLEVRRHQKARMPGYQQIKDLFLAGKSLEEIAAERQIQTNTVLNYLETLHSSGEIDLMGWIEEQFAREALDKGMAYFRKHENPRLKQAYEDLGLDYGTLRMCRLYVRSLDSRKEELPLAG